MKAGVNFKHTSHHYYIKLIYDFENRRHHSIIIEEYSCRKVEKIRCPNKQ
jgi:hypothetical protein